MFQLYNRDKWPIWFQSVCKCYSFSAVTGSFTFLCTGVHTFTSNLWISTFGQIFCMPVLVVIIRLQWWWFLDTWWNVGTVPSNHPWWIIHENATAAKCHDTIPLVMDNCENNGVVSHRNEPLHPFPTNQSLAYIFCVFKNLISTQPFRVRYKYVQSHANDTKRWQDCSLNDWINIKVDRLAKKALMAAQSTDKCIESAFPNEQIWISMGGGKVTGSLKSELEVFWGRSTAKKFFHKKGLVSSAHFDSVLLLGYEQAISKYPKTVRTFITKQVSGWCGYNSKL